MTRLAATTCCVSFDLVIVELTFSSLCFSVATSVMWRNTHPYVSVDRHEDITHHNLTDGDPTCDRSVVFYGYARGSHGQNVHLVGVGDFTE
jgi:hypothetical protein